MVVISQLVASLVTAIIISHLLFPSGEHVPQGLLSKSVLILPVHVETGDESRPEADPETFTQR